MIVYKNKHNVVMLEKEINRILNYFTEEGWKSRKNCRRYFWGMFGNSEFWEQVIYFEWGDKILFHILRG